MYIGDTHFTHLKQNSIGNTVDTSGYIKKS